METGISWLIMIGASAQAGNRASKTLRCVQWKESEPEQQAVTSGTVSPGQLPAVFPSMLQPVSQLSEDVLDCDCLALVTYMFLHGTQGTSCLEVLTCHVELFEQKS